jgi:hypothetical protein
MFIDSKDSKAPITSILLPEVITLYKLISDLSIPVEFARANLTTEPIGGTEVKTPQLASSSKSITGSA